MLRAALLALACLAALASPVFADGNVTVVIDAEGDVLVIGDEGDNDIVLEAEGDLAIRGRNGTTINGSTEPFLLPPVRGRYLVDLGDGHDRFETSTVMTSGSEIRTGDGDDRVAIGNCTVPGKGLRIDTGDGDDSVDVQDSSFAFLRILTGAGDDHVNFFFAFADALQVHTGDGNDVLELDECAFDGPVTLYGGRGTDELGAGNVDYFGPPPKIVGWELPRGPKSELLRPRFFASRNDFSRT